MVERICAKKEIDGILYYFVKWGALPYCEGTWEKETSINDDVQIQLYHQREARKDLETVLSFEITQHLISFRTKYHLVHLLQTGKF